MSRADDDAQLDLFGPLTESAEGGSAGATGAAAVSVGIPARCPVVGKPVCYYDGCHHYQGGACAHPDAGRSKPRRRRGKAP